MPGHVAEAVASPVNASAKSVEALCNDLAELGPRGYAIYRLLSGFAHPSAYVVDEYLDETEGSPIGVALSTEPLHKSPADPAHAWTAAVALVWAGSAVDWFDGNHTRQKQLKAAARELEIPLYLELSETAWLRQRPSPPS